MQSRAKHKLCRRIGSCIWGSPKCPSNKRPYSAGAHGKGKQKKLSTYGELLLEKQKLKAYYGLTEQQLSIVYQRAKKGKQQTDQKLLIFLEMRLSSVVFRCGFANSIFAAKQFVSHRHIKVNGKPVDKPSFMVKPGMVVSINPEKSPSIAQVARNANCVVPPYLEVDRENCKCTISRWPLYEEIPCNIEIMRVIEYYAR